jgi:hypothetical protein
MSALGAKADAAAQSITDTILGMTMDNDARLLAPILGTMAARLYQGLISAGMYTPEDVRKCMEEFQRLALEPGKAAPAVHVLPLKRTAQ